MKLNNTLIISAFPGTGKSFMFKSLKDKIIIHDSDSSTFDKSDFPRNYIEHLKNLIGVADVVLVSSHKEVRDAMQNAGIEFYVVYPELDAKDEYLKRYKSRGSSQSFIDLLDKNWESWIAELNQSNEIKLILQKDEYLSEVIETYLQWHGLI